MLRHLLLSSVLAAGAVLPAAAQSASERPVVVTVGQGVVKRAPDRAWVSVAAESRAKSPREAQRLNADAMAAVLAKLKGLGLPAEAIRTSGYDLQPEFDYANGKQTLRDYVSRNSVEVRVDDLARVGEIVDAAVGSGATSVSGIRFDLKDRAADEREALKRAVADARGRADAAAQGAGMRVERVLRIEEQHVSSAEPPRPMAMMRMSAGVEAAQTPITPGELEVRAAVTLTAAIN
ncbi:MAG: SIMPL domain-containing protein [Acidobacteriota bacterium]